MAWAAALHYQEAGEQVLAQGGGTAVMGQSFVA